MSSENNPFYEDELDAQRLAADSFARHTARKAIMDSLPDLVLPQVSINGSHPDDLLAQQCAIITALARLLRRMAAARPHGRDYQHRPAEYAAARDAWAAREALLLALQQDLVDNAKAINRATAR
jgi:beta-glucosidase-like glycosyl hydrolase